MTGDPTRGRASTGRARRWLLAFLISLAFYAVLTIIDPFDELGPRVLLHFVIVVAVGTVVVRFLLLVDRSRPASQAQVEAGGDGDNAADT